MIAPDAGRPLEQDFAWRVKCSSPGFALTTAGHRRTLASVPRDKESRALASIHPVGASYSDATVAPKIFARTLSHAPDVSQRAHEEVIIHRVRAASPMRTQSPMSRSNAESVYEAHRREAFAKADIEGRAAAPQEPPGPESRFAVCDHHYTRPMSSSLRPEERTLPSGRVLPASQRLPSAVLRRAIHRP